MTASHADPRWRALALPPLPADVLVRLFGLDGALEIATLAERTQDEVARLLPDVFPVEPLPADSPLRAAPQVPLSPHTAGSTVQEASRIVAQATVNLRRAIAGEPVVDVANGGAAQVVRRRGGG